MAQAELVVAAAKGPPDESALSGRLQAADYAARVCVGLKACGGRGSGPSLGDHALVGRGRRFWGPIGRRGFP